MRLHKIALADTQAFSSFFLDYVDQKHQLKDFYNRFPSVENFGGQVEEKSKSFSRDHRVSLQKVLNSQYDGLQAKAAVTSNIERLSKSNAFTVTTGHQLNLFTGPLFSIYKIVTVINACRRLKADYPAYDFVPVFWMASEDHDFEEIRSFRLNGSQYSWDSDQKGPVGRFNLRGLEAVLSKIPGDLSPFNQAYLKQPSLAAAVRYYVNELFGNEGLVVLDGDDRLLKQHFRDVMVSDIQENRCKPRVMEKNAMLEALGYEPQVFVRDINFFYIEDQLRARLEKQDHSYDVLDTPIRFTEKDILKLIDEQPEKLSPNVILRPLYQEMVLPNLAYVGGPAEMIYWLQLKGIFEEAAVPFPILLPRNFALIVERNLFQKWKKTELEIGDLFKEKDFLFNHWTLKNTHRELTLGNEFQALGKLMDELQKRASEVDPTLGPLVAAEAKRVSTSLEKIEQKMLRAEKRRHADKLRQIESVKDALFPGGLPQERTDNFLNFYQQDKSFLSKLIELLDPFDFRFNVLCYD